MNLLVLGFGPRGRDWATRCAARLDIDVAGVVDPNADACRAAARADLPTWPSLDAALSDARAIDAVLVASPPDHHVGGAVAALGAGLAVLVEKPLALSVADARGIVSEAARVARPVLVVQNFRFLDRERSIAHALGEGAIGAIRSVTISSRRAAAAAPAHVGRMPHGVLWDFSIHHLDALRVRFPAPPEGVSARLGSRRVAVHMVWEQAQVSYEHADRRGGYAYRERIDGSRGALVVDDQVVRLVHTGARRGTTVTPPPARAPEDIVLDEFVAAVESGRPSALDAADNIQTVALVERIVASAS